MKQEINTYRQAEEFILSIPKFTVKNTPEDTEAFYEFLGCPGEKSDIIHVAGTNGKGSVCAYLSAILIHNGYKTAMFTSPHLIVMRERFKIDDKCISESDFLRLVCFLNVQIEEWNKSRQQNYHPTFFEFLFFMAMLYFNENHVQKMILETGLGGRLDATNIIKKPKLCIITKIGMDHMEYLGNTLTQIAAEKAGIIKKGVPCIFYDFDRNVSDVIKKYANERLATAISVKEAQIQKIKIHQKSIDFSFRSRYDYDVSVLLPTFAVYQTVNALLAIRAAEYLLEPNHLELTDERIYWERFYSEVAQVLKHTYWEGRMEEVFPAFFVDGAHNTDGMNAFLQTMDMIHEQNAILLFGVNRDKDYEEMILQLASKTWYSEIVTVTIAGQRAARADELRNLFQKHTNVKVTACDSVSQAVRFVRESRGQNVSIYAVGSLYLVGEIKQLTHEGGNHD